MQLISDPLEYQIVLTVVAAVLIFLRFGLEPAHRKAINNQSFILGDEVKFSRRRIIRAVVIWLSYSVIVFAVAWTSTWMINDIWMFDLLAGGYVVILLVGVVLKVQSILYYRGLGSSSAGLGKFEFSEEFVYKNAASRTFSIGLLMLCLYGLVGHLEFLWPCLIFSSLSVCCYRRAKKLSKPDAG